MAAMSVALIINTLLAGSTNAAGIVQMYYIPITEDQAMTTFGVIQPAFTNPADVTGYRVHNIISIVPTRNNTIVYYDQWEDGYELDIGNPIQSSTLIWGDGITTNGTAPGYPTDLIDAGDTLVIEQDVPVFSPSVGTARVAGSVYYDGRDRFGSTYSVSLTRGVIPVIDCIAARQGVCTANQQNAVATVIAGSPAVAETRLWGTNFVMPVGENTAAASDNMFQHVSPFAMAMTDGTVLQVDINADGTYETTVTLNRGQSYQPAIATTVNAGARFTASKPIQMHMATGDVGSLYESRWYQLYPTDQWSNSYISPVSSSASTASNTFNNVEPDPTHIFVYNNNATALTVSYQTSTTATGALTTNTFSVPANSVYRFTGLTNGAGRGVRFFTADSRPFYAIGTIDSNGPDGQYTNDIHDWGFTLIPENQLTDSAIVGWAPSTYDRSVAGNPVWVTSPVATTVYVDYDGDLSTGPLTDPNGNKYNVSYSLVALQVQRVENPTHDNTSMRLYTVNKTDIAVAWGQDPDVAQVVFPFLDLGYAVMPLPSYSLRKEGALVIDGNSNGRVEPGETIEYTLTVSNNGPSIVDGVTIIDTLPAGVTYVPGSTLVNGVAIADNTTPATVFPLDETGRTLSNIPVRTLTVSGESIVKFRVTVNATLPVPTNLTNIVQVTSNAGNVTSSTSINITIATLGNSVWFDEDGNGYQDAGEPGIPNVTVNLIGAGPDGISGNGDDVTVATTVTNANGGYRFSGLAAGTYRVDVVDATLPTGLVQSTVPAGGGDFVNHTDLATFTVTAGGEELTADFGYNWAPSSDVTGGTGTGTIGDRIWVDADGDGIQDPGEVGISGVTLTLYNDLDGNGVYDTVSATTTTNAAGNYIFDNLAAGPYQVVVTQPANTTQTGDPDFPGTPVAVGNRDNRTTTPILVAPGDVYLNADFGYQRAAGTSGTIGDTVWFDADADGVIDAGEYGIQGVSVSLLQDTNGNGTREAGEPFISTRLTNASGIYSFTGVPAGSYLVVVDDTDNILNLLVPTYDANGIATPNISAVTLAAGATNTAQDFGYAPNGQGTGDVLIGDLVFLDADNNGAYTAGEPGMEGVVVQLYSDLTLVATTTTDENGRYYFGDLPASTYTVRVTAPTGYTNSYDPDGGTANQSTLTLAAGAVNLAQDFGYRATIAAGGTIGNLIFNDINGDGDVDAGETGIANVTVDLYLGH